MNAGVGGGVGMSGGPGISSAVYGRAVMQLVIGLSLTFIFVNIGRPMPTRIGFLKMTSLGAAASDTTKC